MQSVAESDFTHWVARLTRLHTQRLASTARSEGLSGPDALDAVQDAFHLFLSRAESRALVNDDDASRASLHTLVRNLARNMRRKHHNARAHEPLDAHPLHTDTEHEVATLLERAEDHSRLDWCVKRLADVQRTVVTLRVLEELSGDDVAERLGLSAGHVAVLLHRAKKQLIECMCVSAR